MILRNFFPQSLLTKVSPDFHDLDIKSIVTDSRKVVKNSVFVALSGTQLDGNDFIPEAADKGAKIIIKDRKPMGSTIPLGILLLSVENPLQILRDLVRGFFGPETSRVQVLGVTGTNGKTTITYLCESLFKQWGKDCAVVGTINYRYKNQIVASHNTTPGIIEIQEFLALLSREKVDYCVMEVSSHALDQGRVDCIDFRTAVFTNLTSDHLDYHRTREDYFLAKSKLFSGLTNNGIAIVNVDDEYAPRLLKLTKSGVMTYGIKREADVRAEQIELRISGSHFWVTTPQGKLEIDTPLIGLHNVYNILSVIAIGVREKIGNAIIKSGVEALINVPGRLESIRCGQDFSVFVDYAHTEDALQNVLLSIKAVTSARIILVFGCGGDRDKTKRPKMGQVAGNLADVAIITNDNPRSEDPQQIAREIISGFQNQNFRLILDREEALDQAVHLAQTNDVVLVAGKGHEDYQIFKDKKVHFDDREALRKILARKLITKSL